jgi:hypothetical protein
MHPDPVDSPGTNEEFRLNDESRDCLIEEWKSAQVDAAPPAFNSERYAEYVADFDYDEATKLELLRTLWKIMADFVDLGFGVNSIQLLAPAIEHARDDAELGNPEATPNDEAGKEP